MHAPLDTLTTRAAPGRADGGLPGPGPIRLARAPALRILYVIEATGGGVGRHLIDLAAGMLAAGHEVHLAYSPVRMEPRFAKEMAELAGARLVSVPMLSEPGPTDLRAIRAVRAYLRRHGPFDVVHGHSSKGGAIARLASTGLGLSRVYTAHAFKTMDPELGGVARRLYGGIEGVLGRFLSDVVISVSAEEAAHARALGIPQARSRTVPNGVRKPDDVPDRATARRLFGLPDAAPCILFTGRLAPQKAPERFVELIAGLVKERPDLHGLMLGFGPLEAAVRGQIAAAGLEGRISLHTGMRAWEGMAAADMLALTSNYEGMSYVLLEAAAMGLPILTTDVAGASVVVRAGENGFVVPPGDAPGLLAAARTMLADLPRFGQSRQRPWTIDDMVAATEDIYRERRPAGRVLAAA